MKYILSGVTHTDTSTNYMQNLGMSPAQIKSVQNQSNFVVKETPPARKIIEEAIAYLEASTAETVSHNGIAIDQLEQSVETLFAVDVTLNERLQIFENSTTGDTRYIHWPYNDGSATGGETTISIPYSFTSVATVFINGVRMSYGLAFDYDVVAKTVTFAEPLEATDEVVVSLGTEPVEDYSDLLTDVQLAEMQSITKPYIFDNVSSIANSTITFPPGKVLQTRNGVEKYVVVAPEDLGEQTGIALANNNVAVLQKNENITSLQTDVDENTTAIASLTEGQIGGIIVFETYALLTANTPDTEAKEQTSYKVTLDPDPSLNGAYSWVTGTTYRKDADTVVNVIEEDNTSEPVSGAAVAKFNGAVEVVDTTSNLLRNLYDVERVFDNTYILNDGSTASNGAYKASSFIDVLESQNYIFRKQAQHVAFYDFRKTYIAYQANIAADTTFTTPAETRYIRFSATDALMSKQSLVKGTVLPADYLEFGSKDGATIHRESLETLRPEVKSSQPLLVNIFDKDAALQSKALAANGGTYPYSAYFTTDFLPVLPSEQFITNKPSSNLCYYDENKKFISQDTNVSSDVAQTSPSGAYYFRFHVTPVSRLDDLMVTSGSTSPDNFLPHVENTYEQATNRVLESRKSVDSALPLDRNLFDKDRTSDDKAISNANGAVYTASNYFVTDFIDVEPLGSYVANYSSGASLCFYDYKKSFLSGSSHSANTPKSVPNNAYYIRFQTYNLARKESLYVVKGTTAPVGYKGFSASSDAPWLGSNVALVGDSITYSALFVPKLLASTGLTEVNNFSAPGRAVASMVTDGSGNALVASDFTTCDFVHILGGTNDYGGSRAIGTISDAYNGSTVATFYNDVYQLLHTLYTLKPSLRIVFSTPTIRGAFSTQPVYPAANGAGVTLPQYVNAIKEICALFGTPVCDLFGTSGLNLLNLSTFTSDNLHPNAVGAEQIARAMAGTINSL
ncbi:MAG: lysophospholipase L1-like esterase [Oleiphilaceae bacterium]|jgi:lysophospholipase L1-like esterase